MTIRNFISNSVPYGKYVWLDCSPDLKREEDARYVIIQQHGGDLIPTEIARAIRDEQQDALYKHIQVARDTGAPELVSEIVKLVPGGLAVHLLAPRVTVHTPRIAQDGGEQSILIYPRNLARLLNNFVAFLDQSPFVIHG